MSAMFIRSAATSVQGLALLFAVILTFSGCGKYSNPIAPERVSPAAIVSLEAIPGIRGVSFKWKSPSEDRRGKELKNIDGYRIYRKEITRDSDLVDPRVEFELLAAVEDRHLVELDKLRREAEVQGKPTRRLGVDPALSSFEYSDGAVEPGKTYAYQIIPYNNGGVEGAGSQIVKITFRGETSDVVVIPYSAFEEAALGE